MKELYNAFFSIPEDDKIPEKVILTRAVLTVVVIIVCLSAMGITAYAYFAHNLTSGQQTIKTASFGTNISIENVVPDQDPVQVERADKKTQVATLLAGNTYRIKIEKTGTASTGYCSISPADGSEVKYHTQQLGTDVKSGGKNEIEFTLTVTNTTKVYFYAHWGTSTYYTAYVETGENDALYILDGETVELP